MFRCEVCGQVAPARVPVSKLVVEVRRVEYPRRKKVHWHPQADDPKDRWVDDPGGVGVETVREVRVCPECAARGMPRTTEGDSGSRSGP